MSSESLCEYSQNLISYTYSQNQLSKVKIDSFEKKKIFEISTENFEKILGAGIWFFWSQTSRNWPNINLKSKNLE